MRKDNLKVETFRVLRVGWLLGSIASFSCIESLFFHSVGLMSLSTFGGLATNVIPECKQLVITLTLCIVLSQLTLTQASSLPPKLFFYKWILYLLINTNCCNYMKSSLYRFYEVRSAMNEDLDIIFQNISLRALGHKVSRLRYLFSLKHTNH